MSSRKKPAGTEAGKNDRHHADDPQLIVGIGSSAGGLEVLKDFFAAMPPDSGMAFVLVSHLSPDRESMLPGILQESTEMEVKQAEEKMKVAPDHVYIIPPDKELVIFRGRLQLLRRQKGDGHHRPVDTFLRSLAEDRQRGAAAIILSGTGTDGSQGVKAVKEQGGLVLVQDSQSAKFGGMIDAASKTGIVDHVMTPQQMPECLVDYLHHLNNSASPEEADENESLEHDLHKIYAMIRSSTGHDFSLYKKNTILRRIERRMFVHQLATIGDYVDYLDDSEKEIGILFKELLIGVTSFFRDEELFDKLRNQYLPELLQGKEDGDAFRVWVPGCSSGEEVYSLAMILSECLEEQGTALHLQFFGTDLDEEAIGAARAAVYPDSIGLDVDARRLKRFFTKEKNCYHIKQFIREMVVFAKQNVVKDPPFTRIDLLSCRNLLIYFGPQLQQNLLPVFHYSLRQDGMLVLGSSENLGTAAENFSVIDKKWKIFRRQPDHGDMAAAMKFPRGNAAGGERVRRSVKTAEAAKNEVDARLFRAILSQSGLPTCVVVDDESELVYTHGRTGRYLEPAEGEVSTNIVKMARPGLEAPLINGIQKMSSERTEIKQNNIRVKDNGGYHDINLILRPLPEVKGGRRGLMLVIFEEIGKGQKQPRTEPEQPEKPEEEFTRDNLKQLQDELRYTRENLKSTVEELETSNEDLVTTNEELQSANEELQSTNEELETSKEELQSLNEEASTVNSELESRIDELVSANDDIKNFLAATEIATIFLDSALKIRRFTPKMTKFFRITGSDVGRPIGHFSSTLKNVDIQELAQQVIDTIERHESVIQDQEGQKYRLCIRPFRTTENVIEGVIITFENVTEFKKMVDSLAESEESWQKLVEHAPFGLFVVSDERIKYINPEGLRIFGASSARELVGTLARERVAEQSRQRFQKQIGHRDSTWRTASVDSEKYLHLDGSTIECLSSATPVDYKGAPATVFYLRCKSGDASPA